MKDDISVILLPQERAVKRRFARWEWTIAEKDGRACNSFDAEVEGRDEGMKR